MRGIARQTEKEKKTKRERGRVRRGLRGVGDFLYSSEVICGSSSLLVGAALMCY
jgi:hypothetical protein